MMMELQEDSEISSNVQELSQERVTTTKHVGMDEDQKDSNTLSEKTQLSDKKYLVTTDGTPNTQELNASMANRWRRSAVLVSWLSIIITLVIGITELVVSANEGSTAAFGLGFTALLDVISSVVVLWRFYDSHDTFSAWKEHVACAFLGFLFIVSALAIAGKGIYDLLTGEQPDMSAHGLNIIITSSIVASCGSLVLFCLEVVIARVLVSWTIFTDALNSLAGSIIAFSMVFTSELTKHNPYVWFLDATVGLCVSIFLLIYGLWLLSKHLPAARRGK